MTEDSNGEWRREEAKAEALSVAASKVRSLLVACPDCEALVSRKARECPHCGRVQHPMVVTYWILYLGVVVALLFWWDNLYVADHARVLYRIGASAEYDRSHDTAANVWLGMVPVLALAGQIVRFISGR